MIGVKFQGKICRKCGGTERYAATGNRCVNCLAAYQQTPGAKARQKKYRLTPKGKQYHRNKTARYYASARGKETRKRFWHSISNQNTVALKKYRVPLAEIANKKKEQKDCCAICGRLKRLQVDHNHLTGKVRGLLCGSCNRGIGLLGDSLDVLRAGVAYLEKHSEQPMGASV